MTAAGVQNLEPAAYLPPPPSGSAADVKGAAADQKGFDPKSSSVTPAQISDFQSELARQSDDAQATNAADPPRPSPGKPGKKSDSRPEEKMLPAVTTVAATPANVADPQKPILPLTLALPNPAEPLKAGDSANADESAKPDQLAKTLEKSQQAVPQPVPAPDVLTAPGVQLAAVQQVVPALPAKQSEKGQPSGPGEPQTAGKQTPLKQALKSLQPSQPAEVTQKRTPAASLTASPTVAPNATSSVLLVNQIPAQELTTNTGDPSKTETAKTGTSPDGSRQGQPDSRARFTLPTAAPEPVAPSVQGTADSAAANPSPLAFAARLAAVTQRTGQSTGGTQPQPAVIPGSQTPQAAGAQTAAEIPARYSATAQILSNTAAGVKQDGPKKDGSAFLDQPARTDSRTDIRTDTVLPNIDSASPSAPASEPAPPQAAPVAHIMETPAVEPPKAPTGSAHDIRVQVPDNNGGSTQVRFVESGGEVRVSVRTADPTLAQNLRTHLNDLTQRLADGGMPAEIWKPGSSPASFQGAPQNGSQNGSQNDQQQPAQQDRRGSGGQGSAQPDREQQGRQQQRPAWVEEMETSLRGDQV